MRKAIGLTSTVYQQAEREFGMLPLPVVLHASAPDALAACWLMLRESLVVTGHVKRDTKEAVATTVSLSNGCTYCAQVQGMALEALSATSPEDTEADHGVRRVADWARSGASATTAARRVPFPLKHVPELVGVVLTFHYINRMANIFLPDSPLPRGIPRALRSRTLLMFSHLMRMALHAEHPPGASLDLLPTGPLASDLAWTRENPHVAEAFARAAVAIDAAGARSVPETVRNLLHRLLANWTGELPDRFFIADAVAKLPPPDRPAGLIAVQTALASSQVDTATVVEFRKTRPTDESLVELTSWASMSAARRICTWITADLEEHESLHG
ncbi:carboxymuconolactone decarboxylase family protein [Saccharopolyspora sp. NPDC000359]|uniref:carboxymuconolactone decarboxylase family protein n=1 Tax=Saccharopolyspora sp. NPDC000359 TaxID=3154251 RepID=UPI00332925FA